VESPQRGKGKTVWSVSFEYGDSMAKSAAGGKRGLATDSPTLCGGGGWEIAMYGDGGQECGEGKGARPNNTISFLGVLLQEGRYI